MENERTDSLAVVRFCDSCNTEMEYNPVTGGYYCTVCGRIDKPTEKGFKEYDYLSTSKAIVRTEKTTDKKCIKCGGIMNYDPHSKMLVCNFCKNIINTNIGKTDSVEENAFEKERIRTSNDWGLKTKTVTCTSCGGKTIYDYLEISGKCLFCGSNQVMETETIDTVAPGGICPFTVDSKNAIWSFQTWIKKRRFCPNIVKDEAKPTDIKGVYLPFWTFDTNTKSQYNAIYKPNRNDDETFFSALLVFFKYYLPLLLRKKDVKKVSGKYNKFFDDVLIPASPNYDTSIQKALEPYNTNMCLPYSPEYIAGFPAQVYSIGLDEAWLMAQDECTKRLKKEIEKLIKNNYNASKVHKIDLNTEFSNITFKCLLLPVWISSYTYKGKIYQFMANGCTGKIGGNSPISKLKVAAAILQTLLLASFIALYLYLRIRYR